MGKLPLDHGARQGYIDVGGKSSFTIAVYWEIGMVDILAANAD
jgi:hypothetical protein